MSQVLFLRHGESAHNAHTGAEALAAADGDLLTERGREQAAAAALGLSGQGVTRLISSPMRRARETAAAIGSALDLEPTVLDYVDELRDGEPFEDLVGAGAAAEGRAGGAAGRGAATAGRSRHLHPLLPARLRSRRRVRPPMAAGIWNLGSYNCGLSLFSHGEARDPGGTGVPGWTCLSWMRRPWDPP